jgi:hypothetical protein
MHLNKSRVEQRTLLSEKRKCRSVEDVPEEQRKCARCVRKPPWVFWKTSGRRHQTRDAPERENI